MPVVSDMHKEDIKAAVRKRGKTMTGLSREAGLHDLTATLSLTRPIPRANRAIAAFLNMTVHDIWPSWYSPDGQRIRTAPLRTKPNRKTRRGHCEK